MASIISAGTSSGTSLNLTGDTSGVLQLASNNGTTAVTINTSQNVGIGTSSPGTPLHVYGGDVKIENASAAVRTRYVAGSNQWNVEVGQSSNVFQVWNAGGGIKTIEVDSSGRVTMPYQSGFMAGIASTSDATISQNSLVPFNTVTSTNAFNTGTNFNTSTNLFTAPVSGRYVFSFTLYFTNSGGSTGNMSAAIRVNGSFISFTSGDVYGFLSATPNSTGGVITSSTSVVLNLSANDTVGVAARGASIRIYQGSCFFSGYLLG